MDATQYLAEFGSQSSPSVSVSTLVDTLAEELADEHRYAVVDMEERGRIVHHAATCATCLLVKHAHDIVKKVIELRGN